MQLLNKEKKDVSPGIRSGRLCPGFRMSSSGMVHHSSAMAVKSSWAWVRVRRLPSLCSGDRLRRQPGRRLYPQMSPTVVVHFR